MARRGAQEQAKWVQLGYPVGPVGPVGPVRLVGLAGPEEWESPVQRPGKMWAEAAPQLPQPVGLQAPRQG